MNTNRLSRFRHKMVEQQIEARGVRDALVLEALRTVPREAFLPKGLHPFAYDDSPLPLAANQTISQPYIVAFMIESLGLVGGETVLEVGTGSGYAAAVLAQIAGEVYTIERIEELAENAVANLEFTDYRNVHVMFGDGTHGWPDHAPFDAIVVSAGGPRIPESLKQQLKVGGRMVIPVGSNSEKQDLVRVTRLGDDRFVTEDIADVRFVPLIGKEGWQSEEGWPSSEADCTHKAST